MAFVAKKSGVFRGQNTISVKKTLKNVNTRTGSYVKIKMVLYMKIFNPFENSFSDVKETDLTKLNNVSEGWNVEYKKEKQNGKSIAKSVSSFANSHGGLYFVGIESNNNLPVNFDGVKDSPDIVRDSVRGNVQPFPYFKTHIISLKNGNHILMVVIP